MIMMVSVSQTNMTGSFFPLFHLDQENRVAENDKNRFPVVPSDNKTKTERHQMTGKRVRDKDEVKVTYMTIHTIFSSAWVSFFLFLLPLDHCYSTFLT